LVIVSSRKPIAGIGDSACEIVLDVLSSESVAAIVRHRLGDSASTEAVIAAVSRLSGGNPFFIEECSRLIQEIGDGAKDPGGRGRADEISLDLIKRSDVQSILAARIDDLPDPDARQLLTACSALGPRFEWEILESISDVDQERLRALVRVLSDAELVFPEFHDGKSTLRFKHAITRDVAYQGMTRAVRAGLHAKILLAYERLYQDRATEFSDILREHAKRAGDLQRAIQYGRLSAMAALDRSAHKECLRMLRDCLAMARSMPETQSALELQVDLLFELRNCLEIIEPGQIFETLGQAEAICARIDDDRRKGILAFHLAHAHWVAGRLEVALEHGRRAVEYGLYLNDPEIRIPGLYHSGLVLLGMGQHGEAASAFAEVIGAPECTSVARRFRLNVSPSMLARSYRARCLAEMAQYDEALAEAEAARRQAKIEREHYAMGFAELAFGHAYLAMGDCQRAIPHLERSVESFLASDAKVMCPVSEAFLGYAMALSGRGVEALPLLQAAVEASRASEVWEQLALRTMFLSEAHLSVGDFSKARETLESARKLAVKYDEQPSLVYIDYQTARIAAVRDGAVTETELALLRTTMERAERMQMMSLARKCGQLMGG
jgi:tetratricopeptide (TPR) repeat protein